MNNHIGIVLMHGKGGSPGRHVSGLASQLQEQGFLVANLEMPWSGRRAYDVPVAAAEQEVETALGALRAQGATKLFVAGHSQGGLFALHFGNAHRVDGVVAIAPGGNVGSALFREKLADDLAKAQQLIAAGKGQEKASLADFEGSKGAYPVSSAPADYVSWFEPDGAMNQLLAVQNFNPQIPVLFIAPLHDYAGLLKVKQQMFDALPKNPLSRLYEPDSSHLDAPSASSSEIAAWCKLVANATVAP